MQLSSIDANLLVVLHALLEEGSVAKAARRLSLSPSATSHALARLRALLGDPLLVRAGRRLVRTPRAETLAARVKRVVEEMEAVFRAAKFDPENLDRTFRLLTTDHIEVVLLRHVDRAIAHAGPHVRLQSRPIGPDSIEALRLARADLAFGVFADAPDDLRRQKLFADRLVTLLRKGHPALRRTMTPARFAELEHIVVAPRGSGEPSKIDLILRRMGLSRRVRRTLSTFLPAPLLVAQSDCVVTLSYRLAEALGPGLGLEIVEPPFELEPYSLWQAWHLRCDADPAHTWFRELIAECAAGLPPLS